MSNKLIDRLARKMGYVPESELRRAHGDLEASEAALIEEGLAWMDTVKELRRQAEVARKNTRGLFQKAADMGLDPECIDGGSGCDHAGNIVTTGCTKGCSPLKPKCAYNLGRRGLQLTEFPLHLTTKETP